MASFDTEGESSPPLYQPLYRPLNKDQREIRLLEILPNSLDGRVNCKLHTVPLTPDLYYTCISYVWGDPTVTEEIIVDGVPRLVTVTLSTALRHVKRHWTEIERMSDPDLDTSKFRLWADAICINQDDLTEKLHQVSMMADIYSSAAMVLAWLSSNDDDVVKAFDIFERIVQIAQGNADSTLPINFTSLTPKKLFDLCYKEIPWKPNQLEWLFPGESPSFTIFDTERNDTPLDGPYGAVFKFSRLEFWDRVWTHQEVILAKRLYFFSPSHSLPHSSCLMALIGIHKYTQSLKNAAQDRVQRFNIDLSEASNGLDHVYGLLDVTKSPVKPDYTKSILTVNLEFIAWALSTMKAILKEVKEESRGAKDEYKWRFGLSKFFNRRSVGAKRLYGLPSWAPVFSNADRPYLFRPYPGSPNCAHRTIPELFNNLDIDIVGKSLRVKGIKVQLVKTVYDEPVSVHLVTSGLQKCITTFTKAQDIHPTGKSVLEILCCTLLRKDAYENYAFDAGLCVGYWSRSEAPAHKGEWTGKWTKWSQEPYLNAVISEWVFMGKFFEGWKLFKTEDGYVGTILNDILPGDVVCVLTGSNELAVLRPEDDHFIFVGHCFMIGLMNGEVSEFLASGKAKIETIEIR
ncbi:hypothetical protein FGADI_3917 [Fusarium gaditjirri]|uniref:Heterokaryon incompatibility domain-containing protein n=1 Tax=Fusarium gaditjirri TaxID=282569 RepID=A0A8H4TE92_9HYPO|nr:hypothetical protein FGADI_3917 [Fusarium gaditjirri]